MLSVTSPNDLVTTKEDRVQGFSWQAIEKVNRAHTFIECAKYFREHCHTIKSVECIRNDLMLTEYIIASCMLSRKSLNHLPINIQNEIIESLVDFSKLTDSQYLLELERRYFLTCGDSLGGTMRNVVGQHAQEILTESIFNKLVLYKKNPERVRNKAGKTTQIIWEDRRVFFDQKPRFINNSIDIIVVRGKSAISGLLEAPEDYVCCGELKGGIDPAGADEHWKTAKTALQRISDVFDRINIPKPNLVFLGAAIEMAMANEIFFLLQKNWLAGAANITNAPQLNEVIDIIIK
ncbi:hypothetical protein SOASR030_00150 [Leminorella grimontii]|uniref:Uncharacterized protein n=1 Tax=Leminorella grimontii TaxID=82981 RepID=A0AAV5MYZ7_9GAMM|nr:AvaI/BsoBI family type II restriction endonuclease [Leminorella grimontii]KFC95523.1 type II restriction enzyme [Leminorella grimontii ATCC 33999 = DSM 5078]GKX53903.1 hypothetical protein SOASR030_00150 [Leminorella grimontii]VFS60624.1 Type-2 restriction enzyme BsoBI [Leminorella grimontii]